MRVMTSFLQVKQVQSYSGPLSQVPLLYECAQRAMLYLRLGSVTGAQGGCSAVRSGHTLFVCLLCVVKVPGAGWARRAANANSRRLIFCYSVFASPPASLVLPCQCWRLLSHTVAPCFSCTLIFSSGSTQVRQEKWKLPPLCWMSNILVILPFRHSRPGCWGVTEVSLAISVYWVWHNEQSQLRYFWLAVSQHARHCAISLALLLTTELTKSLPGFLPVRKLYSALISHSGDRLCDRDD